VKFSSGATLVLVPVVVVDKQGNHVPGLDKDSFTILEDNKPQKVSTFEEIRTATTGVRRPPRTPGEYTNQISDDERPKRITIIALDTINTPFLDQTRGREELIKFLAQSIEPGNMVALVAMQRKGVRVLHDFTTDPAVLINVLRRISGDLPNTQGSGTARTNVLTNTTENPLEGPRLPATRAASPEITMASMEADGRTLLEDFVRGADEEFAGYMQAEAIADTLQAFHHIAVAFAGIPGRKALIWVTGGFPASIDDSTALLAGGPPDLYERTMQALNDASISVYPVDVKGLVVGGPDAQLRYARREITNPQGVLNASSSIQMATTTTLETVAKLTGGKAFYNRNDLALSYKEASRDSSAYYQIGYYLDQKNTKPGWRKLKVKVSRENVEVRARSGFFITRTTVDPTVSRQVDIYTAIRSPIDYTAMPISVRWLEDKGQPGKKRKMRFEIVLPANVATIDGGDNHLSLDFAASARTLEGKAAKDYSKTIDQRLTPEGVAQIKESGITYGDAIEVAPGEYTVRFVVRDNITGRMGSVSAPLKVM
jgi:VWFA-related protein